MGHGQHLHREMQHLRRMAVTLLSGNSLLCFRPSPLSLTLLTSRATRLCLPFKATSRWFCTSCSKSKSSTLADYRTKCLLSKVLCIMYMTWSLCFYSERVRWPLFKTCGFIIMVSLFSDVALHNLWISNLPQATACLDAITLWWQCNINCWTFPPTPLPCCIPHPTSLDFHFCCYLNVKVNIDDRPVVQ